ncbi:hypothetical protein BLEM_1995 [Bifidobacterium lemurum]|uniref:UPF0102 protein BLEM_1995 n=1 Tax=Bifidobacterium lemurum TaxID=1603886 RepID=A0A261FNA2_9BIFI|nr:YraN family protein [Bifidobacterium lemurum]OZG60306.1 hypothetical protein BLEM_1995 [Bifidobacterium lemurum]QOL34184.1 YraN family protein [Bifidobacterium lemurum]
METSAAGESALPDLAMRLCDRRLTAKQFGAAGEDYAVAWLRSHDWTILDRNWQTRHGELDIVAMDPRHVIAFVEVKTRRSLHYGLPQEAVTHDKQQHLRHAAVEWLMEPTHRIAHHGVRFDVITIVPRGHRPVINHIINAF